MSRKLRIEYPGAMYLDMGSWTYVSNLLNEPPRTALQGQEVLLLCQ
jgi:hypothetical protein